MDIAEPVGLRNTNLAIGIRKKSRRLLDDFIQKKTNSNFADLLITQAFVL